MRMTRRQLTPEEMRMIRAGLTNTAESLRQLRTSTAPEKAKRYEALCKEIHDCAHLRIYVEKQNDAKIYATMVRDLTRDLIDTNRVVTKGIIPRDLNSDLREDR